MPLIRYKSKPPSNGWSCGNSIIIGSIVISESVDENEPYSVKPHLFCSLSNQNFLYYTNYSDINLASSQRAKKII